MSIIFDLNVDTSVSLDEINGTEDLIDDEGRIELEKNAEDTLKERIEALIMKIQSEYSSDIFGFGAKLREDNIQEWDLVRSDWQEVFKNLEVNVITMIHIRNSSMLSKPLEKGE